jgi:glutaredoxin-like protein
MTTNEIIMYGTDWCGDCMRAKHFFDKNKIKYRWVNIDHDEAGEKIVLAINHGNRSVPTIIFQDGSILVEPSNHALSVKFKTD